MLARVDSVFLGISFIVILFCRFLSKGISLKRYLKTVFTLGSGVMLLYSPWLLYSYSLTKDLFPVSGKVTRLIQLANNDFAPTLQNLYWPMIREGLKSILFGNAVLIGLICAITLAWLYKVRFGKHHIKTMLHRINRFRLLLLFCTCLFLAYVLYFFGPYYLRRYLFPTTLICLLFFVTVMDLAMAASKRKTHRVLLILSSVAAVIIAISAGGLTRFYLSTECSCCGYMNMGLWAGANLEPGSTVGACQSGALGYFADNLKVINLDGAVNNPCYEALRKKKATEYIKAQRIKYVLGWVCNFLYISRLDTDYKKSDFLLMLNINHFKSWDNYWLVTMVNYGQLDSLLDAGWLPMEIDSVSTKR